jgi:hypothetical protein
MALNIDLEGFGFLSDSDVSKLSPMSKQQPPISPIESESSSGISSLDSDDLKVSHDLCDLAFRPPTKVAINYHIDHSFKLFHFFLIGSISTETVVVFSNDFA